MSGALRAQATSDSASTTAFFTAFGDIKGPSAPTMLPLVALLNGASGSNPPSADLERAMGIEPTLPAWEAGVLPLNYARKRIRRGILKMRQLFVFVISFIDKPFIQFREPVDAEVLNVVRGHDAPVYYCLS